MVYLYNQAQQHSSKKFKHLCTVNLLNLFFKNPHTNKVDMFRNKGTYIFGLSESRIPGLSESRISGPSQTVISHLAVQLFSMICLC